MEGINSNQISYAYKKNKVLVDVSFQAPCGKITFLAGNNGSGKTTWMKIAVELLTQNSGSILFGDKSFHLVRNEVGISFDTPPLYPNLSVLENLYVLYGIDYKNQDNLQFLKDMGFTDYIMTSKAYKLSLGQRHRVGIAGAFLRKPKYLLLDEPDLGVDPSSWTAISKKMLQLVQEGGVVLLTGQNYELYEKIIDHIVVLKDGKIMEQSEKAAFIEKYHSGDLGLKEAFHRAISLDKERGN